MGENNHVQNLRIYKNPDNFRGRSKLIVQLWWIVYGVFFKPSPQFFYGWRRFLLRAFGAKIGKKVIIRSSAQFTYPWKVEIGDYSWIGDEVVLYSLGVIKIGSNAVISQRSYLCTGSHDYLNPAFSIYEKPITVGDECWIATDVFVSPGLNIGKGAVVGARSTVINDIEEYSVNVGSPSKFIKSRRV
ncbi:MAG: colanic acid biosynthesis acetyltransferase WcaF [Bacteroidetes bacterium MedPE-SWsnd-G2]|nr:MAG: colanic acid biosynthesis acetyltransferase WcaF [Bacteroidetes bacterium MedPE-SWsnd-G2]